MTQELTCKMCPAFIYMPDSLATGLCAGCRSPKPETVLPSAPPRPWPPPIVVDSEKVYAVIETLLASWEQWHAEAMQQAQQDQDPQSYRDEMYERLYPLLDTLVIEGRR